MSDAADEARRQFVARAYQDCGPRLYQYAVMILADRQDAEDVVQHAFTGLFTAKRVPDDPEAYLRAAIRHAAYSMFRRRRTRRGSGHFLIPIVATATEFEHVALEQALRSLPIDQREVVYFHVYEGMSFQEIAGATGESINTVSSRYRYALVRLRKALAP